MKKFDIVKVICMGGMLTAFTVIFQAAPVFLPAVGLALSPLSTLPIAIAAVYHIFLGLFVFISSAFILVLVSMQETIILLFTTGLLGIVMGAFLYRKGSILSTLLSSISLTLGMIFLTYIIGVPGFIEISSSMSIPIAFLVFYLFSLVYVSLWNIGLKKIVNLLIKIKVI